jgi:lipopolysaccharide export system permease protein
MITRLLDRYIAREFLRLFILFAIAAPTLFVIGDLTDNLDRYMDRGLSPTAVALSYVYQFPLFVLYSFPIASLIATIFTVNSMTRHSELAAAKASGVSFWRLLAPLPVLGVILTIVALGLSELVPITTRKQSQLLGERRGDRASRVDFVYRATEGYVFAIRRLDLEFDRIYGLVMEREGAEPALPSIHVKAQEATYDSAAQHWTLNQGQLRLLLGEEERHFEFAHMIPTRFRETPEQLLAEPKEPEEMRYAELGEFIEILQRSGGNPLRLIVDRAQKLAIPAATLVIILFGAPLANTSHRGGAAYGIGVSLGITITYLMMFRIFGAAGAAGTIDPVLAAWLPNILVFAAALVLISRVKT